MYIYKLVNTAKYFIHFNKVQSPTVSRNCVTVKCSKYYTVLISYVFMWYPLICCLFFVYKAFSAASQLIWLKHKCSVGLFNELNSHHLFPSLPLVCSQMFQLLWSSRLTPFCVLTLCVSAVFFVGCLMLNVSLLQCGHHLT